VQVTTIPIQRWILLVSRNEIDHNIRADKVFDVGQVRSFETHISIGLLCGLLSLLQKRTDLLCDGHNVSSLFTIPAKLPLLNSGWHTGACISTCVSALAAKSFICGNLRPGFPFPLPVTLLLLLPAQLSLLALSTLVCP